MQTVNPSAGHFTTLARLLRGLGTAGNHTTDSHLAAPAIDRGLVLHTTGTDFARFRD